VCPSVCARYDYELLINVGVSVNVLLHYVCRASYLIICQVLRTTLRLVDS
jgi:hypothetical protein